MTNSAPGRGSAEKYAISRWTTQQVRNLVTVDGPTVPANFTHRNRPIPWRTSATNASSVNRFWVA